MHSFIDKEIKKIGNQARQETLKADEKEAMKLELMKFVKNHPIQSHVPAAAPQKPEHARFTLMKFASFGFAALAVVVFMGGGIALAANKALPGDTLFSLKTNVNEKVLSWLATSHEKKAQLHITLAKRRLEEAEKVASLRMFNETAAVQAKASFNHHVSAAEESIKAVGEEQGAEVSVTMNAGFESLLRAHVQIIGNLKQKGDTHNEEIIQNFQENVDERITSVVKANTEIQEKVFAYNASNMHSYAQSKLADAKNKMKETSDFVMQKENHLLTESYEAALVKVNTAQHMIVSGQQKMESQEYRAAVLNFQKAINIMNETQVGVLTNEKLKINVEGNQFNLKKIK